jgi:AcrR family transcriptional regulator
MSDQGDSETIDESAVLRAAMDLAATAGWDKSSLSDIAAAAGIGEETLQHLHRDKLSVLRALAARIDQEALGAVTQGDIADIPIRERLLELMMLRFDAMRPFKAGIIAVSRAAATKPGLAMEGGCALSRSMRATLSLAGVRTEGIAGLIRIKAMALIFLDAFQVWGGDDSADQSATFRRLDERLVRAESLALALGIAKADPAAK